VQLLLCDLQQPLLSGHSNSGTTEIYRKYRIKKKHVTFFIIKKKVPSENTNKTTTILFIFVNLVQNKSEKKSGCREKERIGKPNVPKRFYDKKTLIKNLNKIKG
jgi:hypothetical protein